MTARACYFNLMRIAAFVLVLWVLAPSPASADCGIDCGTGGGSIDQSCFGVLNDIQPGFTSLLVSCLEGSIDVAATSVLDPLSKWMQQTVGAAVALAIIIFGMRIVAGERELMPRAAGFLLRLGIVWVFCYDLGATQTYHGQNLLELVLGQNGFMEELATLDGSLQAPWSTIDALMGDMMGFDPTGQNQWGINNGILALIGAGLTASATSTAVTSAVLMPAIMALLNGVFFILDIMYTYLKATIIIAFIVVISPFLIPLGLFFYTEHFAKKWLDLLIAAMLTPMLLYFFCNMAIMILQSFIFQVLIDLSTNNGNGTYPDATIYGRISLPVTGNMKAYDVNTALAQQSAESVGDMNGVQVMPDIQSNISPMMTMASDETPNVPGLDFSANQLGSEGNGSIGTVSSLVLDLAALWLLGSLLKHMLRTIPDLAGNIAGVMTSIGFHTSPPLKQRFQEGWANMKLGTGFALGGIAGGNIGAKVGGAVRGRKGAALGRQIGGLAGAVGVTNAINGRFGGGLVPAASVAAAAAAAAITSHESSGGGAGGGGAGDGGAGGGGDGGSGSGGSTARSKHGPLTAQQQAMKNTANARLLGLQRAGRARGIGFNLNASTLLRVPSPAARVSALMAAKSGGGALAGADGRPNRGSMRRAELKPRTESGGGLRSVGLGPAAPATGPSVGKNLSQRARQQARQKTRGGGAPVPGAGGSLAGALARRKARGGATRPGARGGTAGPGGDGASSRNRARPEVRPMTAEAMAKLTPEQQAAVKKRERAQSKANRAQKRADQRQDHLKAVAAARAPALKQRQKIAEIRQAKLADHAKRQGQQKQHHAQALAGIRTPIVAQQNRNAESRSLNTQRVATSRAEKKAAVQVKALEAKAARAQDTARKARNYAEKIKANGTTSASDIRKAEMRARNTEQQAAQANRNLVRSEQRLAALSHRIATIRKQQEQITNAKADQIARNGGPLDKTLSLTAHMKNVAATRRKNAEALAQRRTEAAREHQKQLLVASVPQVGLRRGAGTGRDAGAWAAASGTPRSAMASLSSRQRNAMDKKLGKARTAAVKSQRQAEAQMGVLKARAKQAQSAAASARKRVEQLESGGKASARQLETARAAELRTARQAAQANQLVSLGEQKVAAYSHRLDLIQRQRQQLANAKAGQIEQSGPLDKTKSVADDIRERARVSAENAHKLAEQKLGEAREHQQQLAAAAEPRPGVSSEAGAADGGGPGGGAPQPGIARVGPAVMRQRRNAAERNLEQQRVSTLKAQKKLEGQMGTLKAKAKRAQVAADSAKARADKLEASGKATPKQLQAARMAEQKNAMLAKQASQQVALGEKRGETLKQRMATIQKQREQITNKKADQIARSGGPLDRTLSVVANMRQRAKTRAENAQKLADGKDANAKLREQWRKEDANPQKIRIWPRPPGAVPRDKSGAPATITPGTPRSPDQGPVPPVVMPERPAPIFKNPTIPASGQSPYTDQTVGAIKAQADQVIRIANNSRDASGQLFSERNDALGDSLRKARDAATNLQQERPLNSNVTPEAINQFTDSVKNLQDQLKQTNNALAGQIYAPASDVIKNTPEGQRAGRATLDRGTTAGMMNLLGGVQSRVNAAKENNGKAPAQWKAPAAAPYKPIKVAPGAVGGKGRHGALMERLRKQKAQAAPKPAGKTTSNMPKLSEIPLFRNLQARAIIRQENLKKLAERKKQKTSPGAPAAPGAAPRPDRETRTPPPAPRERPPAVRPTSTRERPATAPTSTRSTAAPGPGAGIEIVTTPAVAPKTKPGAGTAPAANPGPGTAAKKPKSAAQQMIDRQKAQDKARHEAFKKDFDAKVADQKKADGKRLVEGQMALSDAMHKQDLRSIERVNERNQKLIDYDVRDADQKAAFKKDFEAKVEAQTKIDETRAEAGQEAVWQAREQQDKLSTERSDAVQKQLYDGARKELETVYDDYAKTTGMTQEIVDRFKKSALKDSDTHEVMKLAKSAKVAKTAAAQYRDAFDRATPGTKEERQKAWDKQVATEGTVANGIVNGTTSIKQIRSGTAELRKKDLKQAAFKKDFEAKVAAQNKADAKRHEAFRKDFFKKVTAQNKADTARYKAGAAAMENAIAKQNQLSADRQASRDRTMGKGPQDARITATEARNKAVAEQKALYEQYIKAGNNATDVIVSRWKDLKKKAGDDVKKWNEAAKWQSTTDLLAFQKAHQQKILAREKWLAAGAKVDALEQRLEGMEGRPGERRNPAAADKPSLEDISRHSMSALSLTESAKDSSGKLFVERDDALGKAFQHLNGTAEFLYNEKDHNLGNNVAEFTEAAGQLMYEINKVMPTLNAADKTALTDVMDRLKDVEMKVEERSTYTDSKVKGIKEHAAQTIQLVQDFQQNNAQLFSKGRVAERVAKDKSDYLGEVIEDVNSSIGAFQQSANVTEDDVNKLTYQIGGLQETLSAGMDQMTDAEKAAATDLIKQLGEMRDQLSSDAG